jgi:hypothetical protein
VLNIRILAAAGVVAGIAVLVACAGRSVLPTAPTSSFADAAFAPDGGAAFAHGFVYSDPQGKPLGGVRVAIAPWTQPNIAPHLVATTKANGSFSFRTQPGHYLLVIGNDVAYTPPPGYHTPDPLTSPGKDPGLTSVDWVATVHDNITLRAGSHEIHAPRLPVEPGAWQKPGSRIAVPAVEKSGNYRIAKLTPVEAECYAVEQTVRQHYRRSTLVADEWLVENARAVNKAYIANDQPGGLHTVKTLDYPASHGGAAGDGGSACAQLVITGHSAIENHRTDTALYGGVYAFTTPDPHGNIDGFFFEQWYPDPRTVTQAWP